jgi:hypothetical protein
MDVWNENAKLILTHVDGVRLNLVACSLAQFRRLGWLPRNVNASLSQKRSPSECYSTRIRLKKAACKGDVPCGRHQSFKSIVREALHATQRVIAFVCLLSPPPECAVKFSCER